MGISDFQDGATRAIELVGLHSRMCEKIATWKQFEVDQSADMVDTCLPYGQEKEPERVNRGN